MVRFLAAVAAATCALACAASPALGAYKLVKTWGGTGAGATRFWDERGITFDGQGHLWVVDWGARGENVGADGRVEEFTRSGKFIRQVTGRDQGLLMQNPIGVTADRGGHLFVADMGSAHKDGLIWEFRASDGKWLRAWNVARHGRSYDTEGPVGVAVGNGELYDTDFMGDFPDGPVIGLVQEWNRSPVEVREWGGAQSTAIGHFVYPTGIVVGRGGNVYVADNTGGRIEEFTPTGFFVRQWSADGAEGLAIDRNGTIYAAEPQSRTVVKYDPQGHTLGHFRWKGKIAEYPEAWLTVDRNFDVYLTNNGTNTVQKFAPHRPQTTIVSGPSGASTKSLVRFKFKSSEKNSSFVCDLRGPRKTDRTVSGCNLGDGAFYVLKTGRYTLRVRALDAEGIPDRTPAVRHFRILDGTPPTVTAPVQRLVRGGVVGTGVPLSLSWTRKDNRTPRAKLVGALQQRSGDGTTFGDWTTVQGPSAGLRRATMSLPVSFTFVQFRALATDAAGNTGQSQPGPAFRVLAFDDASGVTYSGAWSTVSDADDYHGSAHSTTQAGATASFAANVRNVGVAMPRAPGLGKAKVCVDGATCATIDLGAVSTPSHARLVYVRNGLDPAQSHTVTVTDVSGRVDLDAVAVLG